MSITLTDLLGGAVLAGLPGGFEVWIILLILLLLFGNRIPGVARSLGQGISSFKKGLNDPMGEGENKDADAKNSRAEAPESPAREKQEA